MGRTATNVSRTTICFMCDEKAVHWHPDFGGHSTCYCLNCLMGYYSDSELDYTQLDLTKTELIDLIFERVEGGQ